MATNHELHQLIARSVTRDAETAAADSIVLWRRLSVELVGVIGDIGFAALYARSIHVVQARHPWLADQADPHFERLSASLAGETPAIAADASIALLTTFIDTLIQLIGASLTTAILRAAWNHEPVTSAAKESPQC